MRVRQRGRENEHIKYPSLSLPRIAPVQNPTPVPARSSSKERTRDNERKRGANCKHERQQECDASKER